MGFPNQSVTLTVEQIAELRAKLSNLRHDVNNHLSLILGAAEVIRLKPQLTERMTATLTEQPSKIMEALARFSGELEKALGKDETS